MSGTVGWLLSDSFQSSGGPLASMQSWTPSRLFALVPIDSTLTYPDQVGVPVGEGKHSLCREEVHKMR